MCVLFYFCLCVCSLWHNVLYKFLSLYLALVKRVLTKPAALDHRKLVFFCTDITRLSRSLPFRPVMLKVIKCERSTEVEKEKNNERNLIVLNIIFYHT